ncbi:hypothetical protein ACHAXH_008344 [Discostella pseudostelligera]
MFNSVVVSRLPTWKLLYWIIIQEIILSTSVAAYSGCNYFARSIIYQNPLSIRRLSNDLISRRRICKCKDSDDDAATPTYTPPIYHISTTDLQYMKQAISLAQIGYGNTFPNPAVGCVLVRHNDDSSLSQDTILGTGFHPKAGMPHAEIFALFEACGHVDDGSAASRSVMRELPDDTADCSLNHDVLKLLDMYKSEDGASKLFKDHFVDCNVTAYVTLEPCCHTGQTPPCALSLVAAGINRVVVGYRDPNPRVDGGGIQLLKNSGVEVHVLSQDHSPEAKMSNEEVKVAKACSALVKYFVKRISPQTERMQNLDDTINGKHRRALRSIAGRLKADGTMQEVSWSKDKSITIDNNEDDVDYANHVPIDNRFLEMVDQYLWDHEIVLLRLNNAVRKKKGASALSSRIGEILNAHVAQVIGHTALLYRPGSPAVLDLNEIVDSIPD